jgi:excisionase family DNA binding protein
MSETQWTENENTSSLNMTPVRNRLTCTVREACSETGIGKTKMHELINGGALESVKVGRRRLVKVPSLLRLVGQ